MCIYIYIYMLKQMLTLNVWLQIYGLKNTHNLLKAQAFLFFSEALSMCNEIRNENTDNSATKEI